MAEHKTIDTSELGPIRIEPPKAPATRLELLERVNRLNMDAHIDCKPLVYWTCTVLYNTVIWKHDFTTGESVIFEVYKGVLK